MFAKLDFLQQSGGCRFLSLGQAATVLVTEAQARKGLLAMDTLSSGVWTETLNKEKK